jgi:hypothetical protein
MVTPNLRAGLKYKIFPLFNIEFMALQKDLQEQNIRVNDPANPSHLFFRERAQIPG